MSRARASRKPPWLPLLAALATVVAWAAAFPAIALALKAFQPAALAAGRFAIAAMLAVLWLLITRSGWLPVKDWPRSAIAAGLGIAGYNMFLNSGQTTVSPGAASFIVNTTPVFTAILATVFAEERFNRYAWLGSLVSLGGVGMIALGQPGGLRVGSGGTLVLGAAVCLASFFIVQRPLVQRHGALRATAWILIFGALWLLPWLPLTIAQARTATASSIGAVVLLAALPSAVGYATWSIAQAHYGPARAANFLYLIPPTAAALSLFWVGDVPTWTTLVGGLVVLSGVVVVNRWGTWQRAGSGRKPTPQSPFRAPSPPTSRLR